MSFWPYNDSTVEKVKAWWKEKHGNKPSWARMSADEQRLVVSMWEKQDTEEESKRELRRLEKEAHWAELVERYK